MNNSIKKVSDICICCDGKGTQVRNDGIRILCPECKDTGVLPSKAPIWEVPYTSPQWYPPIIPLDGSGCPPYYDTTKITC